MAYMSQELKKKLAPGIKAVFKKYGVKGTIGVRHHSSLVVTIREGVLDLVGDANEYGKALAERRGYDYYPETYPNINPYYCEEQVVDNKIGQFYKELKVAMMGDEWYDRSDAMTDYFDTAYYMDINVGAYEKPYKKV
jgi:hypothetical protein